MHIDMQTSCPGFAMWKFTSAMNIIFLNHVIMSHISVIIRVLFM